MIPRLLNRSFIRLAKIGLGLSKNLRVTPVIEIHRQKHFGSQLNRGQSKGKKRHEFREVKSNDEENEDESSDLMKTLNNLEYETIVSSAMHVSNRQIEQEIFIIQPYIKWGPRKSNSKPDHQLNEAEALIRSIPNWNIAQSVKIGVDNFDKRTVFGPGQLENFKAIISKSKNTKNRITAVFVSKGMLSRHQKLSLEQDFGVPVLDRYSVVIQILRLHATSAEAKLQVAMAEIPYIWTQMGDLDSKGVAKGQVFYTDAQKELLKRREVKIKEELQRIRSQRMLLRRKRTNKNFPIVAVVGYTNAGKTSLIKALTNEESMQPKNQLFATLDVTSHAGLLPCKLNVIYMDTVGFMSDIPTQLIECFIATLEDAMLADVILHVQDIAHENYEAQKKHVESTLEDLFNKMSDDHQEGHLPPVINVGNKIDLFQGDIEQFSEMEVVSSKTFSGINDLLQTLENAILQTTKRRKMTIKVRSGGEESAWLYKNTAVTHTEEDPKSSEHILMHVVISDPTLQQFRHKFIGS
uniref:CSON011519 protein n=1 Tax=Culicoides sonorensis TaxID=179676 RepID=A0A336M4B6_CULSO